MYTTNSSPHKPVRTVRLYGILGKKFGYEHRFGVRNAAEAVRALCATFPEFQSFCRKHNQPGYHVITDNGAADDTSLHFPSAGDIRIIPAVAGGKSKFLGIILGIALIGISFMMPAAASFTMFGKEFFYANMVFGLGVSMTLSGIASALYKPPNIESPESPDNRPNFAFNGAVNTTQQGAAVPVGYGELVVGSVVVSASMSGSKWIS